MLRIASSVAKCLKALIKLYKFCYVKGLRQLERRDGKVWKNFQLILENLLADE